MRILESPEGYVERLEKERKKSAKWREDELKRRQEEELRECKFQTVVSERYKSSLRTLGEVTEVKASSTGAAKPQTTGKRRRRWDGKLL
eukprot:4484195-Amphidinium_carterae.2